MPLRPVEFSPEALLDLRMILQESEERWGSPQAERYNSTLEAACGRIGSYPEIGSVQADLPGIRALPSGQHRIYHLVETAAVLIIRLLHQRIRLSDVDIE